MKKIVLLCSIVFVLLLSACASDFSGSSPTPTQSVSKTQSWSGQASVDWSKDSIQVSKNVNGSIAFTCHAGKPFELTIMNETMATTLHEISIASSCPDSGGGSKPFSAYAGVVGIRVTTNYPWTAIATVQEK